MTTAPGTPTLMAAGVEREAPAADAPVRGIADGITRFGYQLSRAGVDTTANWVMSPLSIAYAFAMARAGAGGQTAAEIDRVFDFPASGLHEALNAVTADVVTERCRVGNGVFTQADFPVGEPFLRTLAIHYGAGVHPVDFASAEAAEIINGWVRRQTADRIKKLFDTLDANTKLVLANTVYLKASWEQQFTTFPTTTQPFTRADGDTTQVPMMHQYATLRYADGDGGQAVELPYKDSELAMWVLVPATGRTPSQLLSPTSLEALAAGLRPEPVDLSMPRWDFATTIDLRESLMGLGLVRPFQPGADFAGISPGLYIYQAVHRANITVDEWGTEAAAATGLAMITSAHLPPKTVVRADRPFAFAIVHRPTGVPLFTGAVGDPS